MNKLAFIIIALLWVSGLYFGYIHMVGKTMNAQDKATPSISATNEKMEEQRLKMKDLRKKQERLMEERKIRARDGY